MAYQMDAENVSLADLRRRIDETDLVPSRASLLGGIETKLGALERQGGVTSLAGLRYELRNPKRLEALSSATGVDREYLVLLRREIEGYFPKPSALTAFDWLPEGEIAKLETAGMRDTAALHQSACSAGSATELARATGVDVAVLEALTRLADLTRVQWVSPTAARMLVEAGYDSASKVAAADAGDLSEALARVNEGDRFFRGRIGLRDVKRLIGAAGYVPG